MDFDRFLGGGLAFRGPMSFSEALSSAFVMKMSAGSGGAQWLHAVESAGIGVDLLLATCSATSGNQRPHECL